MSFKFLIFDVETNGLQPRQYSVLSFSALYVTTWRENGLRHFDVVDEFDRYYFPMEPYNPHAIRVNGLTAEVIEQRRARTQTEYPLLFIEDKDVPSFCQNAELAVCHNTPFDSKFLKAAHRFQFPRTYCTMRGLTQYCSIPHPFYGIKWPKLEEAIEIVCHRNDFAFHDSLADCHAVLELLKVLGNSSDDNGGQAWSTFFDELFVCGMPSIPAGYCREETEPRAAVFRRGHRQFPGVRLPRLPGLD